MRNIIAVECDRNGNGDDWQGLVDLFTEHREAKPGGDDIRKMARDLDSLTKRGSQIDISPDDSRITQVVEAAMPDASPAVASRAADALCILWQVPPAQLPLDDVKGSCTVRYRGETVNGVVAVAVNPIAPPMWSLRLRHLERSVVHGATEMTVHRLIADGYDADKLSVRSRERGSTTDNEVLEIIHEAGSGLRSTLRFAQKAKFLDRVLWPLAVAALAGLLISIGLHLFLTWSDVSAATVAHVQWVDGWVGRLSSAAIFGVFTGFVVTVVNLRESDFSRDGEYLMLRWGRAKPTV
jgi:hypothetical protein